MENQSIFVQKTHSAKDIDLICFKTFPIIAVTCLQVGPMSLDWLVDSFTRSDFPRSSPPPEVPSGEQQVVPFPAFHTFPLETGRSSSTTADITMY